MRSRLVYVAGLAALAIAGYLVTGRTGLNAQQAATAVKINGDDMLAFYSPTEIKSLFQNFPEFVQGETRIACFGPATIKAVKAAHLRIDVQAPRPQVPSLTMAIEQHLKDLAKKSG